MREKFRELVKKKNRIYANLELLHWDLETKTPTLRLPGMFGGRRQNFFILAPRILVPKSPRAALASALFLPEAFSAS